MPSPASDFIDLLSSGDESKIKCVLMPTLGGAVAGGILFSETGPGAAVAAVLGGLSAYMVAYKMCGAATTRGAFDNMMQTAALPKPVVGDYENALMDKYGITPSEARYVSKTALVYLNAGGKPAAAIPSTVEGRNAVHLLLRHAGMTG